MNTIQEIDTYSAICNNLRSSDIYLGSVTYDFHYVAAEFSATCTEAFPFDPFDKIICALLEVDEVLSLEQIGFILGMNVGNDCFKDQAEYEILRDALQSLFDFGMIESGDIDFSRCKLTTIGKEYTTKKHKFRSTENKPFTIYFDLTTGNHEQAKFNYEYSQGKECIEEPSDLEFTEDKLKRIASTQASHVYNEEKLRSFKDPQLKGFKKYHAPFIVAFTFNVDEKSIKCYCLNSFLNFNPELTNWIHTQELIITQLFNELYERKYAVMAEDSDLYVDNDYVFLEENKFLSSLEKLVAVGEQTIYLTCDLINKAILINVERILERLEGDSRCFVSLPSPEEVYKIKYDERLRLSVREYVPSEVEIMFSSLKELSSETSSLYVAEMDSKSFNLLIDTRDSITLYSRIYRQFEVLGKKVMVKGYGNFTPLDIQANVQAIKSMFAEYFIENEDNEYSNLTDIINSYLILIQKDELSIDILITLKLLKEKIEVFKGCGVKEESLKKTTSEIETFIASKVYLLKSNITERLNNVTTLLDQELNDSAFELLSSELDKVRTEIEILDDKGELQMKFQEIESLFFLSKARFDEERKIFSFIIDTNVLLDDPDIITRIDKKHSIIIAAKVLDELDKFKRDSSLSNKVSRVIKIIQQDKNRNIKHNKGRPKLLPPDLNEKTPDNLILSVAIQYHGSNGVLLTSDNLLAVKAKNILELEVMNLQQFKEKFDQTINN